MKQARQNITVLSAEIEAYSKQAPVLYVVTMANALTVAITHFGLAPFALTIVYPAALILVCLTRMAYWLRSQAGSINAQTAPKMALRAKIVGPSVGAVFLVWALALWQYGTAETRGLLSLSIGMTGIVAVFGLMHMRQAAVLMVTILSLPFALYLLFQGWVPALSALNILVVQGGAVYVLMVASSNFKAMVVAQIEANRLSDENLRIANQDNLTGLPNRRYFFTELDDLIEASSGACGSIAVGVLDLDGFKPVNDLHGHIVGDKILVQVASRLKMVAGSGIQVARMGGDEFALIVCGDANRDAIGALGIEICSALREPFKSEDATINIAASVGFALYPESGKTAEDLYEKADHALYHIKQNGRGRSAIYDTAHKTQVRATSRIDQGLRHADLEAELSLNYQPLLDLNSRKATAFEALARWNSPTLGQVSPAVFIPIAERTDLIHSITQILLRKALGDMKSWPQEQNISFNLSMRDLLSPSSIFRIVTTVRESGIRPSRVEFEVTETALVGDVEQVRQSIHLLKSLGAKVVLDDFGTGHSSLSQVHRFAFDKIKVDRSFVSGIETDPASRTIIRAVVDLCRSLNIGCVIEGIESEQQAEMVVALGCTEVQGFLYGRPISSQGVIRYLEEQSAAKAEPLALSA